MERNDVGLDRAELEECYARQKTCYDEALILIGERIRLCMEKVALNPTIKSRVKNPASMFKKKIRLSQQAKSLGRKLVPPLTDILGFRLICPFVGDRARIEQELTEYFTVVEVERKGSDRSFREFGYESVHVLLEIPGEIKRWLPTMDVGIFEVQIRTILQDAWAEVEHELVYKAEFSPFDEPMKRKLAALNANLTLSDIIFQEIRDYQHQLSNELTKRRSAFYRKIEHAIDDPLFSGAHPGLKPAETVLNAQSLLSIDDMLLEALNAHNRNEYILAIDIYSRILGLNPKHEIKAIIHTHRGMAYFSESRYLEAIEDFGMTLSLDPRAYKAAYYRGVVRSVLEDYSQAIEDYNLVIQLHPNHFYTLYRRSQAYFHIGDYPKALSDCDAAASLDPENGQISKLKDIILAKLKM